MRKLLPVSAGLDSVAEGALGAGGARGNRDVGGESDELAAAGPVDVLSSEAHLASGKTSEIGVDELDAGGRRLRSPPGMV